MILISTTRSRLGTLNRAWFKLLLRWAVLGRAVQGWDVLWGEEFP